MAGDQHIRARVNSFTAAKRSSYNSTYGKYGISNAASGSENDSIRKEIPKDIERTTKTMTTKWVCSMI